MKSSSETEKACCVTIRGESGRNVLNGLFYGLVPHFFCVAFIVFSLAGSVAATAYFKEFLVIPYFFPLLIGLSLVFATVSAIFYLKKKNCFCLSGIKNKWKYLAVLYSSIAIVNMVMFFVVFPAVANVKSSGSSEYAGQPADFAIQVDIPCTGHATLITDEIKKDPDVISVKFEAPSVFQIKYDPGKTSPEKIASLEIFREFGATIL